MTRDLDVAVVELDYNEYSDSLYLYVLPGDQPLVSVPSNEGCFSLLVDPDSEEVQGFQIDGYLQDAIVQMPQLLELAEIAGVEQARIEAARQRVGLKRRQAAAISVSLGELLRSTGAGHIQNST